MKAIILAAGYGTRLQKDISDDTTGQYDHLLNVPKPLLPIGNKPLISHWMPYLQSLEITDVYVVTNGANHHLFMEWAKEYPEVKLVCEESLTNLNRSGAVACIQLAVSQFEDNEDTIIIAGDTLFDSDFDIKHIVKQFSTFKESKENANVVVTVAVPDEAVHLYGILETDEDSQVTSFLEKPQSTDTSSRKSCPCFYILNKSSLPLLEDFLEERKFLPKESRDATGHFIKYLFQFKPVYAVDASMRFDVGNLKSYVSCNEYFTSSNNLS